MIPLGVLASSRVAPSSGGATVIAHDVFNCGVSHTLAQHVTAGHPLVGSFVSSLAGNTRVDAAGQTMYFDSNSGYGVRVLADAGSGAMRAEGRIVGQAYVGATAQDRFYGLIVGAPAGGSTNAIGAVSLVVTPAGIVYAAPISSAWTPAGGVNNTRGTIPAEILDDFTVAMSVTGLDVAIAVNGAPFAAFALAAPPPGTHAGAHISRVRWDTKVGYKRLKVEAL